MSLDFRRRLLVQGRSSKSFRFDQWREGGQLRAAPWGLLGNGFA